MLLSDLKALHILRELEHHEPLFRLVQCHDRVLLRIHLHTLEPILSAVPTLLDRTSETAPVGMKIVAIIALLGSIQLPVTTRHITLVGLPHPLDTDKAFLHRPAVGGAPIPIQRVPIIAHLCLFSLAIAANIFRWLDVSRLTKTTLSSGGLPTLTGTTVTEVDARVLRCDEGLTRVFNACGRSGATAQWHQVVCM